MNTNQNLTNLLINAANSFKPKDLELFFSTLLASKVYVPIHLQKDNVTSTFLYNTEGELKTLPIFTEENFLISWAEREINVSEESFKTLIYQLPPNTVLHLNPGQDIGKEFSPVEVELFKKGREFVQELVEIALEEAQDDFEIELPTDDLLKLQPALLPVLEIYEELEEAYLLSIKETSSKSPRALVGIKYNSELDQERLNYIRSEIERTAKEFLISPFTGIFIVDDLGNSESPNQTLFLDFKPFYQRKYDK